MTRNITKSLFIGLLIVAVFVFGYVALQKQGLSLFSANVVGVGGNADPLKSGLPCFPDQSQWLEVTGGSGSYDWFVTPATNVLSTMDRPEPASVLEAVGGKVMFTIPTDNENTTVTHYVVEAVVAGTLPGMGGGETFEVNIAPSCVTAIEFLSPGGSVVPENGEVQINTVQATLSNGSKVTYDGSELAALGIQLVPDPADQVKLVGNKILVPFDHSDIQVGLKITGNSLEPVTFDKYNHVAQFTSDDGSSIYTLNSDEVDPDSVAVFAFNAELPGDILEPGIVYSFVDVPHDNDSLTDDYVKWIGSGNAPSALYIAYLYRPSDAVLTSTQPLTIAGSQCEDLQVNLYQGRGQGFYFPQEGDTPAVGSISQAFDFGADVPVTSVLVSNPVGYGNSFGSAVFEYVYKFNKELAKKAVLVTKADSNYEIAVRDEGVDDPAGTAANFAYAVNTIAGSTSPFVAYINPLDNAQVLLYSLEVGAHTNNYSCSINGVAFGSSAHCFSGGTDGTSAEDTAISNELDPPVPLDPVLHQGETRAVYSKGGISNLTWSSSDNGIFSVAPLSDASQYSDPLTNDNVVFHQSLNQADFTLPSTGSSILTASQCVKKTVGESATEVLDSCLVTVNAPITLNLSSYTINIIPSLGSPFSGTIQVNGTISGLVTGSKTLNTSGGTLEATGTFTGSVGGSAIGTITAKVAMQVSVALFSFDYQINNGWTITSISGELDKDQLIPTTQSSGSSDAVISNFAVLTAKKPGQATLFVSDKLGCTVPLEVEVLGEKLFVDFDNQNQSEFIEPGDSLQLRAWTGFSGTVGSDNDVTNLVEWLVDENTKDIIEVSKTGLVTAKKPGTAKVYAKYSTGTTETGTVTSEGSITIRVNELYDMTISLDNASLAKLSTQEQAQAYKSVAIAIHNPSAAGRSIAVEGETILLTLPVPNVPYASELEQIEGIVHGLPNLSNDGLIGALSAISGIQVTAHSTLPGVLILEATGDNAKVDISTTALPKELTILPAFSGAITLPSAQTYQLITVGEYDDGRTRLLTPLDVKWVNTPVNVLKNTALEAGLIQLGGSAGTSTLFAQVENADKTVVKSNTLTVVFEEGPIIDFVKVVGAGAILKGGKVDLLAKIKDIDTVDDLQELTVSLVKTNKSVYADILNDSSAVWFKVNSFLDKIEVTPVADVAAVADDSTPTPAPATPQTPASQFKNFNLPIQIPFDGNLFDGAYKLVVFVADKAGHEANFVLPIYIGKVPSGDVNMDGKINMIDVILTFQIANGKMTPTQQQLQAANVDGIGKVGMIDVILLFQKVLSTT